MTLQQLKYALTIADCGSMNEAAKQLFISQPSLSETMKELETEIGLDIFLRSNRGIVITPEGEEFLGYARQVTEQFGLLQSKYIDKKVKVLSGGERTRLAMIKLLLQPVNLLILDEPTNHLDLKTKDILKNALLDFDGTLIVVSHDRDFLNGLVKKVYEFGNKKVTEHLEDINGFLRKKKMENLKEIESKKGKNEK